MSSSQRTDTRRMKGVSLALKLAFVIAAVVAAFMVGFGVFLSHFIQETVEGQVMAQAVEAARAAATADFHAWTAGYGTEDQGLAADEVASRVGSMSPFEFRLYNENTERLDQVGWNRKRLQRLVGGGSDVLAVELFRLVDGKRGALVSSSYQGDMSFAPAVGSRSRRVGAGEAVLGVFAVSGRSQLAIRGSYPVFNRSGVGEGEFALYIDAAAVSEATASVKLKLNYAAMLLVLLGAGISYLLGWGITRPLKRLQEDIRVVAGGDLMHHTRSRSSDEIGELARTFDGLTRSLAAAKETERESAQSLRQVEVAGEVAASLFPETLPAIPGHDVAARHAGREALTGIQYDVLPMKGGRFGLLLAEASGSGVAAAFVMTMARSTLRAVAAHERDPGAVLVAVNQHLAPDLRGDLYVKALLLALDPSSGKLWVANAGHPSFLHLHAADGRVSVVHSEGIALGFESGPVFERTLKVLERQLLPGDRLLLHTAAVPDLLSADGEALGENRLGALLKREGELTGESFVARVDATLRKFAGGDLPDDVTLLTLGRLKT